MSINEITDEDINYFVTTLRKVEGSYPKVRDLGKILGPRLSLYKIDRILRYLERARRLQIDIDGNSIWIREENKSTNLLSLRERASLSNEFIDYLLRNEKCQPEKNVAIEREDWTDHWSDLLCYLTPDVFIKMLLLLMIHLGLSEQKELKEFEWYLLDHFFRQSNKGITRFRRNSLPRDMIMLYLRYRNYNMEKINEMLNPVLDNLLMRRVITDKEISSNDNMQSFELTSYLSRLQCSVCFYISYLNVNEPRKCLRCTSNMLQDFPKTIRKKKYTGNK